MMYTEKDMFKMHELTIKGKTFNEAKIEILEDRVDCDEGRIYTLLKIICSYYNITEKQVRFPNRAPLLVSARRAFSFLSKKFTSKSLQSIGKFINRDHASVLHQIRTTQNFLDIKDQQTVKDIEAITEIYYQAVLRANQKKDEEKNLTETP